MSTPSNLLNMKKNSATPQAKKIKSPTTKTNISMEELESAMRKRLVSMSEGKTCCPSDIPRALCTRWRDLMPLTHKIIQRAEKDGWLECLQRGSIVHYSKIKGQYRIRYRRDSACT